MPLAPAAHRPLPPPPPNSKVSQQYDRNRIEVLRLLLSASSEPLFSCPSLPSSGESSSPPSSSSSSSPDPEGSRWLAVTCGADAPNAVPLFYSLLNVVLGYDNIGYGVPYSSAFSGGVRRELMGLSLQLLVVLLDYGRACPPAAGKKDRGGNPAVDTRAEGKVPGFNVFRAALAAMREERDFAFCFKGFSSLLNNTHQAVNTYLPSSIMRLACYEEVLVLLWKFLEENPLFLNYVLTSCDPNELVVPLCFLMFEARDDDSKSGLVHICCFILLKLSGERSFGIKLNKPFVAYLPIELPLFKGTHADLLVITFHKLIAEGSPALATLHSCLLTTVCNISPYWKSISLVAAVKLVGLFELYSGARRLLGPSSDLSRGNLALLLEIFNNAVQYQYGGNQQLVYVMIRRKQAFRKLIELTKEQTLEAVARIIGGATTAADAQSPIQQQQPQQQQLAGGPQIDARWVAGLKAQLPLDTVNRLLSSVVPLIDDLCKSKDGVIEEAELLAFLKDLTLVGLLPVPHPIVIRKYQTNALTSSWFTTYLWGIIYLRNQKLPIFDGDSIKLFAVSLSKSSAA